MNKQIIDDAIKALFNREKKWSCGALKVLNDGMDTKLYYNNNWVLCLYNNKNILLADYFPEVLNYDIHTIYKKVGIYTSIRQDYINLLGINLWFNSNNIEDVWLEPMKWTDKDTLFIHMKQELKNNEGEIILRSANISVLPRKNARDLADSMPSEEVIEHLRSED